MFKKFTSPLLLFVSAGILTILLGQTLFLIGFFNPAEPVNKPAVLQNPHALQTSDADQAFDLIEK